MTEYRCKKCRKLLFKYFESGPPGCVIEIKCERCGKIEDISIPTRFFIPNVHEFKTVSAVI